MRQQGLNNMLALETVREFPTKIMDYENWNGSIEVNI